MFSFIYKFTDNGRHGCSMRWCWSCKQARLLWNAKESMIDMTKISKHFHTMSVSVLNKSGLDILEALKEQDVEPGVITRHLEVMFGQELSPHLEKIAEMFTRLHKRMHEKVEVVETVQFDGRLQKQHNQYSLYDILANCANLKGEGECHTGCPFHDESLLVHLIAAAVFSAISALQTSYEYAYNAFVTSLFHDCGKPSSKKGGTNLCPCHWECGVSSPVQYEHHHGEPSTKTTAPVIPPHDWSPYIAGTNIMDKIRNFLVDNQIPEIIEPPTDMPLWQIASAFKCQLSLDRHEAFDNMIKECSRPCECARYPGHGLLGAILLVLFKDIIASTMPDTLTTKDRVAIVDAMIRTVQIHMSLHNCGNPEVCHKVLAHENHLVRILASYMYVGDNLGKIRSAAYQEKVPFNQAYDQFIANMESLPVHASLVALNQGQKVTILHQGQSGSGKSTFIESLKETLPECHRLCVISRDECIAQIITGRTERLTGEQYNLMYQIYNKCKSYHKKKANIANVNEAVRDAQEKGLQLSPAFTNITEQSVPNVMQLVDSAFTDAYNTALENNDVDVIVVDSCLTLWETAVEQHLPRLNETIVITVPFINFAGIVSTANGLSEQNQLNLSGSNTIYHPAGGVFASSFFDPIEKKKRNTFHQAPPVILRIDNGIMCTNNITTLTWIANALGDQPIVHPTRVNTSGMKGCEFIQHLVDKHNRDMLKVRDELFKAWDVTMNGIYPYEQHTASKKERIIKELVEYTSILHENGILDKAITKDEFASNDELFWNTIMSINVVKYKDGHNGSKFWVNEFMRHFRGITIFTHPITGKVTVLRYLMDRGAEIHSKVTNKRATRQDECDTNGVALDHISKCLLEDLTLNAYLTQKADGSLGTATVYSGMALVIMKAYVETWGTDVVKELARQSLEMTQGKFMVVIATQGTKSLSTDMTSFATTSIFGGIRDEQGKPLVSREEMSTKTPLQIWQEHGSKFLERIFAIHGPAYAKYPDDSITLMFEMICAGNRDAFPGAKYHDEFACNATKDQFLFLGLGYASLEVNLPHCIIDINGAFQQPAFWKIENAKQVNEMIRDLQLVMCGKMTKLQFIKTYPPVNPIEFDELHPEGFVLYGYVADETTPIHQAYALPGILTYAKVKTLIYYMAHKFKVENIEALVEYGRVSPGHFPLCDNLYNIYSSGKLQQLLTQLHGEIKKMLDVTDEQSPLRIAIVQLDTQDGDFSMHPLQLLERIKTKDIQSSFIGALLKEQSTPKDITLSQLLANMLTGLFIKGWNATFNTSIQTLGEVKHLGEESAKISMTAKARELFDEKKTLAQKERMSLLQMIKKTKPWSDEWHSIATSTNIPKLLKNELITHMVDLQQTPSISLPTTRNE